MLNSDTGRIFVALDLNDINDEGIFVTSTGEEPKWFNWAPNEPNNFISRGKFSGARFGENFVEMYVTYNETAYPTGKWNDVANRISVIDIFCEMDPFFDPTE